MDMVAMAETVSPMELLAEDVESEDDLVRLKAYKRIRLVAEALGPDATETELLPFLAGKEREEAAGGKRPQRVLYSRDYTEDAPDGGGTWYGISYSLLIRGVGGQRRQRFLTCLLPSFHPPPLDCSGRSHQGRVGEGTDDEVLLVIARELGKFNPLAHSPEKLLPLLGSLAEIEETVVREAAVESLKTVFNAIPGPTPLASSIYKVGIGNLSPLLSLSLSEV